MSSLTPDVILASRPDEVQTFLRHMSGTRSPSLRDVLLALTGALLFAVFLPGAAVLMLLNAEPYQFHELVMSVLFAIGGIVLAWFWVAYQLARYRVSADHVEARSVVPGASWFLRPDQILEIRLVHGRSGRHLLFIDKQGNRRAVPLLPPFDTLTTRYERARHSRR